MDIVRFKKRPILGILRCSGYLPAEEIVEAIISSGLETIEIAMNSEAAPSVIERSVKAAKGRLMIGAGTVLNTDILKLALDSGATFIVSPALIGDVAEYCVKRSVPFFPGALTPKEIFDAWRSGATMVKVFPAGVFGPSYMKEIKAPFNNIELLACGGVTQENIKEYFACGASAVAFGGSIFKKNLIDGKDFLTIERSIRALIAGIR
ncbi:MAG: bifunctional 4-hydroxy-2-oxoglutarate aldolase/2-dehydro-3-deoxy-phosphogluconate aldolase [Candidatus Omnitrophica bacterium]|nr:bifunctional 4-hydroxy-2-oxoglutarate aldolase/2-dehydro-3-deoxy-phosphogluconate aldolase [Candidatus Omnitrophota bacterium]MBU1038442.1 bifunctional 4-hydroxy-2-oxoglutarate aldolase/2-dehydro-3-deoxy-phosphogluconate aldolase [Candidatus Omnitrophota bacterium]